MSTRYAQPGSPLNQNRFASSPAIERGLLGNLVAARCSQVADAGERETIWALQGMSHQIGLDAVADEIVRHLRADSADPVIRSPASLEKIIEEADSQLYLMASEKSARQESRRRSTLVEDWDGESPLPEVPATPAFEIDRPRSVEIREAHSRKSFCETLQQIPDLLARFCLDPAFTWPSEHPQFYPALRHVIAEFTQPAKATFAHTELSRAVWSEIHDAHQMGGLILLHNTSGNGKSFAAKAYCDAHPGQARYMTAPSTNDEVTFLREFGRAVGCANGLSFKAVQIRERIIQSVSGGDLALVIDCAQFLFPVSDYRYALPHRLSWILTALCEQGVPVVMIASSSLFDTLGLVEARTGWRREQFVNQLARVVELPNGLSREDVQAVAAALLPDGEKAAQRRLSDFMIAAPSYLHSGDPTAQRARRIAAAQNRERVTLADVEAALGTMIPAASALKAGLARADAAAKGCKSKVRNWRPETPAQLAAKSGKRRNQIVTSSDLKQQSQAAEGRPAARLQRPGSTAASDQISSPLRGVLTPDCRVTTPDLATV